MPSTAPHQTSLGAAICAALNTPEPRAKVMATRALVRDYRLGRLNPRLDEPMPASPARPERPELLPPNKMPRRSKGSSLKGRVALWHALAHIEYVAIDLALDMAGRFGGAMGDSFVRDFLSVAADEAMHFALIARKLESMGSFYGALPAHGGLWESAEATKHDVAARLAVVPMVLEARGLDVTPATIERVRAAGDVHGVKILSRILDDEIRHVRIGTSHFISLAQNQGKSPSDHWKTLTKRYFRGVLKPPFNDSARLSAGLSRDFYL